MVRWNSQSDLHTGATHTRRTAHLLIVLLVATVLAVSYSTAGQDKSDKKANGTTDVKQTTKKSAVENPKPEESTSTSPQEKAAEEPAGTEEPSSLEAKKAEVPTPVAPSESAPQEPSESSDAGESTDAAAEADEPGTMATIGRVAMFFIVILAVLVGPIWLGGFISRRFRAKEYGWRLGLAFVTFACAALVLIRAWNVEENRLNLPLGVDLKGGVILIYEVTEGLSFEEAEDADPAANAGNVSGQKLNMGQLCQAIKNRIDPAGTQEIVVRPYGAEHVEVIIPEVGPLEIERIKRLISTAGAMEFRIVANTKDHSYLMRLAKEQSDSTSVTVRTRRQVIDEADGTEVGFWSRVARDDDVVDKVRPFKIDVRPSQELLRIAVHASDANQVGRIIELPPNFRPVDMADFASYLDDKGIKQIDVLMYRDLHNVTGKYLGIVKPDYDERGRLCVGFTLRGTGAALFSQLTGQNIPDPQTGFSRRLGIVLDNNLLSAPNIQSRISRQGQITGEFSQEEIDFLVGILRSGRLPAALDPNPISENNIGSELGEETIRKGQLSIVGALLTVLIFILFYYRFAGIVACLALLLNLVFILALMVLLSAPLTLPGLAGLVLTVGMSVDANVLIFERIREEIRRGTALRMAIRNGFSRATATIVDANVTTLITALVLYLIGTDQIRGFAVTLIFGILMSMYTAIFVSRIVFDLAERTRRLTNLRMMHVLTSTSINFLGKRSIAAAISLTLIVIGLAATVQRGTGMFDIDFNGGTSVTFLLREPMSAEQVRQKLQNEFANDEEIVQLTVNEISQKNQAAETKYRVTSSLVSEQALVDRIKNALVNENGSTALQTYSLSIDAVTPILDNQTESTSQIQPKMPAKRTFFISQVSSETAQETADGAASQPSVTLGTLAQLEFAFPINAATLVEQISDAANQSESKIGDVMLSASQDGSGARFVDPTDLRPMTKWQVRFPADETTTRTVLNQLNSTINSRPVIPEASKIGAKVAENTKADATWALFTSLIGIIGYIWLRFQRLQYGLAAVIALVHDVLITLGAIAVSKWAAGAMGFMLIEEFKISLPVVAAFLTIVGYSLNDTIVVFDRIREVRGKSPDLTADMINASINQTLSRTILTSLTTLIVVAILFFFGGEGIHSFAFALVVGVIVGTYSSIFIASPSLLIMLNWSKNRREASKLRPS